MSTRDIARGCMHQLTILTPTCLEQFVRGNGVQDNEWVAAIVKAHAHSWACSYNGSTGMQVAADEELENTILRALDSLTPEQFELLEQVAEYFGPNEENEDAS